MSKSLALVAMSALTGFGFSQSIPPQNPPEQMAPPATGLTTIPLDPPNLAPLLKLPAARSGSILPSHVLPKSPDIRQIEPNSADHPITLLEAIGISLAVNPQLARAGQNVIYYRGLVSETRSAFGPTVSLSPAETYIHRIADEAYGLQATVPIDISQLLATATKQAQFEQVGARLDVNRIRNEVVYSVNSAFFNVLRAQALVQVDQSNLQDSLDRLRDAKVRYHAEAVAYIDVLRAQTDVGNAENQLIQAQSDVNRSLAQLSVAMGVDPNSKYSVASAGSVKSPPGVSAPVQAPAQPDVTSPNPFTLVPAPKPSTVQVDSTPQSATIESARIASASVLGPEYDRVLDEALRTRPEIWEGDAAIAAAKEGISLAKRSLLPSLSVGIGYYDERSVTGTRYNEPQGFVGLSFPLFDSGLANSRVEEAKALVEQQVNSKRQAVDSVTVDVQNSYFNLVQARSQVAVANQALTQAQAAFDLARIRYNTGVSSRPGVSPLIEVSDAQVALTLAEQNQVNALYDYNVAKAQLDRAVGRFAFVLNDPSGLQTIPSPQSVGLKK